MAKYQNIDPVMILEEPAQVLKDFQKLLGRLNELIEEEALLEGLGGDLACSWHGDLDAAWRGVAEDAAEICDAVSTGALMPLKRMAGLMARAVEAMGFHDLEKVRDRSERCVASLGNAHCAVCRDLVTEAHECIEKMAKDAAIQHARDVAAETRVERRELFAA